MSGWAPFVYTFGICYAILWTWQNVSKIYDYHFGNFSKLRSQAQDNSNPYRDNQYVAPVKIKEKRVKISMSSNQIRMLKTGVVIAFLIACIMLVGIFWDQFSDALRVASSISVVIVFMFCFGIIGAINNWNK